MAEEEEDTGPTWRERDLVQLTLVEQPNTDEDGNVSIIPIRVAGGTLQVIEAQDENSVNTTDDRIAAFPQDRVSIITLMKYGGGEFSLRQAHIPVVVLPW